MSGHAKEIQEIIHRTYNPLSNDTLIKYSDEFVDSDDDELIPNRDRYRYRNRNKDNKIDAEETRLLNLIGKNNSSIREQIINSNQPDRIKAKCLQMLREYEDDAENNSTALSALHMIIKLPTELQQLPISLKNSYEETTNFLQKAWDHMKSHVYGQDRAKSEIIEYLVSKLLTPTQQPRILGLVGPPGVGKTSLAIHGIADVMGVPFHQLSIGGLRDVAYFSGVMRCWKGAHQGKFTDILTKEGCLNPIIYIDELDKVAVDTANDIYGLFTHVADVNTNKTIQDHYLGIDLDLSNVTIIFSYNDPSILPAPLRDRIKEIYFDGFNGEQKVDVARSFIIPQCLKEYGLSNTDIVFNNDVIAYANKAMQPIGVPEISGVRYLNKGYQSLIGKIMVNVICNEDSYSTLKRGSSKGPRNKNNIGRAGKIAQFMPYYRQVKLPYRIKLADIDYYLTTHA